MTTSATTLACAASLVVAAIGAVTDWRTGRIPNWLTLPPLLAAPLVWGLVGGLSGALYSLLGALGSALVPYLLFRRQAAGGGDVKLFAAIGALAGVSVGVEAQLVAFVAAALVSLARLAWDGKLLRTLANALFLALNPILPRARRRDLTPELMTAVRLGVFAFVGTVAATGSQAGWWM